MAAADDRCRSDAARLKRREQLSRWRASEVGAGGGPARDSAAGRAAGSRVRFAQGAVFMAACSAGDRAEVRELLAAGAQINGTNVDGLTALHQACIDENVDMVHFLLENGAYVNQPDNEGWTPLHAAASCGFVEIAEYLLKHGANIAAVNSEGELPLDVAHENAMEKLLKAEIKNQGIDLDTARQEEEQQMIRDARQWVNKGKVEEVRHPKTGATALHVAAAKGYVEVMKLLLQVGYDVDVTDADGWTPLHAAAHWGQPEACRLLVEDLCNMEAVNTVGQTPLDVADDSLLSLLEDLKKKQSELRLIKQKKKPSGLLIESSISPPIPAGRARRSSISRMSSKEKISLLKESRTEPTTLERLNDEDDKKESSSSSSEEEEASGSESDAESEKVKTRERVNNLNNKLSSLSLTSSTTSAATTTTTVSIAGRKVPASKEEEKSGPPPAAWRTTLRKTSSSSALNTATAQPEEPKGKEAVLPKSASSPRVASELYDARAKEATEPRLARVPPTPTRRLFNNQENNLETTNRNSLSQLACSVSNPRSRQGSDMAESMGVLNRMTSQARRFGESDVGKKEPSHPQPTDPTGIGSAYLRSLSFGRRMEDPVSTSAFTSSSSSVSATQTATTAGTSSFRVSGRIQPAEESKPKEAEPVAVTNTETKERRRSYLTPVRDEEAEAQRKARSRHARQSRRSTQGVTLTDLKEAEKTIKAQQEEKPGNAKEAEPEMQEKADESKDTQSKSKTGRVSEEGSSASEVSWRSRIASLQKSDLLGLTSPSDPPRITAPGGLSNANRQGTTQPPASKELEKSREEEKDLDDKGSRNRLGVRDRRRPRGKRRSTGVPLTTRGSDDDGSEDDDGGEGKQVDGLGSRGESVSNDHVSGRSVWNPRTPSSITALLEQKEPEKKDFKKLPFFSQLYEDMMKDNGRIRLQLQEMQSLVTQTKVELEKANQRQERTVDRSVLLDTEKREKVILERRISELQEELKVLADLKADNQRLKDENGALIRVISKLSK